MAAVYEQERVFHAVPMPDLEDQGCKWMPGEVECRDRVDAPVWVLTELALRFRRQWRPVE